jgi:hypothetical protein
MYACQPRTARTYATISSHRMSIPRKLASLGRADGALLVHAGVVVVAVHVALRVLPWPRVIALLHRLSGPRRVPCTAERLSWAVRNASRMVPGAACLTQALALHYLLRCWGQPSCVRIGVANDRKEGFRAHAWVEHGERMVIGGPDTRGFTPLTAIRGLESGDRMSPKDARW